MKLCFIADARSPIARNWIGYFVEKDYEVHIISSYPCPPGILPRGSMYVVPVGFSSLSKVGHDGAIEGTYSFLSPILAWLRSGSGARIAVHIRHWLAPFDVLRRLRQVRAMVDRISPDLVHAMRIPYEGILAARAVANSPLVISVWGNDFTLHAKSNPWIGRLTRESLRRADALHCDCQRDLSLAYERGFARSKLAVVLPGAGGIQTEVFYPDVPDPFLCASLDIPKGVPVVINPRGFREYVRNDTFFRSIPLILNHCPDVVFLCVGMSRNPIAERWARRLNVNSSVRLLPSVTRGEMANLFRLAHVMVSPSEHDGTPNTLLEGMACGAFPVAGDIESIREWISDGMNGLLCNPRSPQSLAGATVRAIEDSELREKARLANQRLIAERADHQQVMTKVEEVYRRVTTGKTLL